MNSISLKSRMGMAGLAAAAAMVVAVPSAYATVTYDENTGLYYDDVKTAYYDESLNSTDASKIPSAAQSTAGWITAAATRAAMPAAEILGLAGVEESGQFVTFANNGTQPVYSWTQPKYMIFCTNYNSAPSPYLTNLAINKTPKAVINPGRSGGGQGPNAVLDVYGEDATDDAVWDLQPQIIIGTNGLSDSELAEQSGNTYSPAGVNYSFSDYSGLESTMTAIGVASGNSAVQAKAALYNSYIESNIATVRSHIYHETTVDGVTTATYDKTVAWITGYDSATGKFTLGSTGNDGTASANRYLETATKAGAYNLGLDYSEMTAEQLAANDVSLILVGGQQSAGSYSDIMGGIWTQNKNLLNKTYFVKDNGSYGSTYGVVMNSVENAQNVGRILPYLDSSLNQRTLIEYYYQNFYRINSGEVTSVVNKAMDGVRNWENSITDWTNYPTLDSAIAYLTEW